MTSDLTMLNDTLRIVVYALAFAGIVLGGLELERYGLSKIIVWPIGISFLFALLYTAAMQL